MGSASRCTFAGRRRNGGGAEGAKTERPSRRSGGKTGKRAAETRQSIPCNRRNSWPAVYFLSEYCDQRGPAEHQTEIRTLCGSERRAFPISKLRCRGRDRPGAQFPARLWPGNGRLRKTIRFFHGHGSVEQFFW